MCVCGGGGRGGGRGANEPNVDQTTEMYFLNCLIRLFKKVVKSSHLYLGRVALSALGWYQFAACCHLLNDVNQPFF